QLIQDRHQAPATPADRRTGACRGRPKWWDRLRIAPIVAFRGPLPVQVPAGMARIEHDEDERDDNLRGSRARRDWRRRLVTWTLAAIGLGIGFLVPYSLYLNQQISQRFGELRWQVPTRVYARPLRLAPGLAMDAQALKTELDAAAYREGDGVRAGTYLHEDGRWTIASRGFRD